MPSSLQFLTPSQRLVVLGGAVFTCAAGILAGVGAADVPRFVVSALALAALAALVGDSIDQVGERLGPGPTGLVQSSLGNLPELFVGIFALRAGLTNVVQAALVGSVLGNLLLVLGVAFVTGGARHGTQAFEPEAPRMLVELLALAVAALLVPTLAARLDTPAVHHTVGLSDATAIVLLVVYLASIPFWLSGGPEARAPGATSGEPAPRPGGPEAALRRTAPSRAAPDRAEQGRAEPGRAEPGAPAPRRGARARSWPLPLALTLLGVSGTASGFVSDWFVDALKPATHALGLSTIFTGLVVVAIAANAVENAAGIRFAWKARPNYAISSILNSPLQIALFLTPVLVLISQFTGPSHLTLVFPPLMVTVLAAAVIVVAFVIYDGEYSWLEGTALVALYIITAAAFWWG